MPSRIDRDVVIDAIWRRATTATDVIAATASRGRPALTTSEKGRGRVTAASSFHCEKRQIHGVVPDIKKEIIISIKIYQIYLEKLSIVLLFASITDRNSTIPC